MDDCIGLRSCLQVGRIRALSVRDSMFRYALSMRCLRVVSALSLQPCMNTEMAEFSFWQ